MLVLLLFLSFFSLAFLLLFVALVLFFLHFHVSLIACVCVKRQVTYLLLVFVWGLLSFLHSLFSFSLLVFLPPSCLSFPFFYCLRKIVTSVSLQVYIDDLLGERVWVDREDCKGFVDNILTAFTTKAPPKHLMVGTDAGTLSSLTPGGGQ